MSISCRIVEDLLPLYVEGLTSDDSNKAIDEHLMSCSNCKDIYQALKKDIEVNKEEKPVVNKVGYYKVMKKVKRTLILMLAATFLIGILTGIATIMEKNRKPDVKVQLPNNIRAFKGSKIIDDFTQAFGNSGDKDLLLDNNMINISFTQDGVIKDFHFQILAKDKKDVYRYRARNDEPNKDILKITKESKIKYEINSSIPLKGVLSALEKITWDKILELNLSPSYYSVALLDKIGQGSEINASNFQQGQKYLISADGIATQLNNKENIVVSKDTYIFYITPMFKTSENSFSGESKILFYVEANM